jgi:hypothetical protein
VLPRSRSLLPHELPPVQGELFTCRWERLPKQSRWAGAQADPVFVFLGAGLYYSTASSRLLAWAPSLARRPLYRP